MTYDDEHQETGSSNISKATLEWKIKLAAARSQAVEGEIPLLLAYELVNAEVAAGIPWSKCQSCGSPYMLKAFGASSTHCSPSCYDEAVADLNEEVSRSRGAYEFVDEYHEDMY